VKTWIRITGWGVVLAALSLLFYLAPTQAQADFDGNTRILLLTDAGVQSVTMADYLPGAVAAEMPASFGAEALKAQAVAARTYVLHARKHAQADVCEDSGCCLAYLTEDELQAEWGADYTQNMDKIRRAVAATDGEILTYDGKAIQAVFHASSYGVTESSESLWSALPYLTSVPTPETADTVPNLVSELAFTPEELCQKLGVAPAGTPEAWLGAPVYDEAGRVALLPVGDRTFSGAELRSLLSLRSTAFTAAYADGQFVFTVMGYGHGVGMSQYGAMLLAADGWSYDAILAHYYPGAVIQTLSAPALR